VASGNIALLLAGEFYDLAKESGARKFAVEMAFSIVKTSGKG